MQSPIGSTTEDTAERRENFVHSFLCVLCGYTHPLAPFVSGISTKHTDSRIASDPPHNYLPRAYGQIPS